MCSLPTSDIVIRVIKSMHAVELLKFIIYIYMFILQICELIVLFSGALIMKNKSIRILRKFHKKTRNFIVY